MSRKHKYLTEEEFDKIKIKVANGDKKAIEILYLSYIDLMYKQLHGYVGTDVFEEYKDTIIGEAFMKCIQYSNMYNDNKRLFTWRLKKTIDTYGIKYINWKSTDKYKSRMNNYSLERYMEHKANNNDMEILILRQIAKVCTDNLNIEEDYISNERVNEILKIVYNYEDKRMHKVVELKLKGYKMNEIAKLIGMNYNTLVCYYTKFKKALKEVIDM